MEIPAWDDISGARQRISPWVHRTPVLTCSAINKLAGCEIFFKCENFQKAGAFKFRGASNAVLSLTEKDAHRGVATHSSGNHAAALALAARLRGIRAHIVMPENAPLIKKEAVSSYGGDITFCVQTLEAREQTLMQVVEKTGAVFIHPYNNFNVICGQATAAIELLEDTAGLDAVVVPVGGGGLLSGTSIAVKSMSPGTRVFAAEPKNADDAFRSFKTGILQPSLKPDTLADGLLTSLSPLTFKITMKYVDDIFCVGENDIIGSMRLIWERMKIIIEPSSAVTLAAVLTDRKLSGFKRIGIILTGGNVDLEHLPF